MMTMKRILLRALALLAVLALAALHGPARAEPYLALRQGWACSACHVNATGGGLRNALGNAFAQKMLAAHELPDSWPDWSGSIGTRLRLGADLRDSWSRISVPRQASQSRQGLDQLRLYADLLLLPDWLSVYLDEQLAPGAAQRQEAYLRLSHAGAYLKAGQFYLPLGWRLQDASSLVREVSGIGMTTPDKGVELGLERPGWSAQLAYSKGPGNAGTDAGHQWTGQLVWLGSEGRIGLGGVRLSSAAGDRSVLAGFGGWRFGALVLLGELDLIADDGYPEGRRRLMAGLAELNWSWRRGHNLKFSAESYDPDRHVREDQKARFSLVYEYTPLPFLQLRGGLRRYQGIPQNALDHRRLIFLELHAFI